MERTRRETSFLFNLTIVTPKQAQRSFLVQPHITQQRVDFFFSEDRHCPAKNRHIQLLPIKLRNKKMFFSQKKKQFYLENALAAEPDPDQKTPSECHYILKCIQF